jgi:hypothetical protein
VELLVKELANTEKYGLSLSIGEKYARKGGRVNRSYVVNQRVTCKFRISGDGREYKRQDYHIKMELLPKDAVELATAILEHYAAGRVGNGRCEFEVPEEWLKDGDEE